MIPTYGAYREKELDDEGLHNRLKEFTFLLKWHPDRPSERTTVFAYYRTHANGQIIFYGYDRKVLGSYPYNLVTNLRIK